MFHPSQLGCFTLRFHQGTSSWQFLAWKTTSWNFSASIRRILPWSAQGYLQDVPRSSWYFCSILFICSLWDPYKQQDPTRVGQKLCNLLNRWCLCAHISENQFKKKQVLLDRGDLNSKGRTSCGVFCSRNHLPAIINWRMRFKNHHGSRVFWYNLNYVKESNNVKQYPEIVWNCGVTIYISIYISIRATIGARSHGSIVAPWSPQDHLGEESRCWDRRWGANFHAIGQVTREDLRAIQAIASLEMIGKDKKSRAAKNMDFAVSPTQRCCSTFFEGGKKGDWRWFHWLYNQFQLWQLWTILKQSKFPKNQWETCKGHGKIQPKDCASYVHMADGGCNW